MIQPKKEKEAKLSLLVKGIMLTPEELKKMEKLRDKEPAISKLLDIYNAFKDQVIGEPLMSLMSYLTFAKTSLDEAIEYLSSDELVEVHDGSDEEGQPIIKMMPQKVAVMVDKQNGMPERFRDIGKNMKDAAIDVMEMVSAQRILLNGTPTSDEDIPEMRNGMGFADHVAKKSRGKNNAHY